jgi:hypothetical protein
MFKMTRARHMARRAIGALTAGAVVLVSLNTTSAAWASPAKGASDSGLIRDAITLSARAGFATIDLQRLTTSAPKATVALTPTLAVKLHAAKAPAMTDGQVSLTPTADGVEIAQPGGVAIVTGTHAELEFRYTTIAPEGTALAPATDGGLNELNAAGHLIGHIDPALAIDQSGQHLPASYGYDAGRHELVVRADTTAARGAVFIDPSWQCYAVAGAYGAVFVLAAAAWLFTDGSVVFVMWALRAWFGLSFNAANAIARACTLH